MQPPSLFNFFSSRLCMFVALSVPFFFFFLFSELLIILIVAVLMRAVTKIWHRDLCKNAGDFSKLLCADNGWHQNQNYVDLPNSCGGACASTSPRKSISWF